VTSWAGAVRLGLSFRLLQVLQRRLRVIELLRLEFFWLAYLNRSVFARKFVLGTLVDNLGLVLHTAWTQMSRIWTWRSRSIFNKKRLLRCVLSFQLVVAYVVQS